MPVKLHLCWMGVFMIVTGYHFYPRTKTAPQTDSTIPAKASVQIHPDSVSTWTVAPQLFGSFMEEHWGDISPGIYEQYLVNPSFEPWYTIAGENKTRLVFKKDSVKNIAYPWQPWHGKGEEAKQVYFFSDQRVNARQSQQIELNGDAAGVQQQLALPDYRVMAYKLQLYVRATGNIHLKARFLAGEAGGEVVDETLLPVTAAWTKVETILRLKGKLSEQHLARYGIVQLALVAEGTGIISFDQATLFPVDCVDGKWNPETIKHIKAAKVTAIRWPGGNYTSGYHWKDGIGNLLGRPSVANRAWGGTEPNHVGTDEWLRYCELTGIEPVMGVGFGEITANEAADWVEYCNGAATTKWGALRASNGHPKPYGVKVWGIGNEVYGDYQIGHTDAVTYAKGFLQMARQMKERDSTINIVASGVGVHNNYRKDYPEWNRILLDIAGPEIDLLDIHYYVYGPNSRVLKELNNDSVRMAILGADARLEKYYKELRTLIAASEQTKHIKLVHYEWGVLPNAKSLNFGRQTFINLLATAVQYHAFLRNADLVKGAMFHNFSYYISPVAGHSEPVNPRTRLSSLYHDFIGCRVVKATVTAPCYSVAQEVPEIGVLQNVSEIDVIALKDKDKLYVSLLNRNLNNACDVKLSFDKGYAVAKNIKTRLLTSAYPDSTLSWHSTYKPFSEETAVVTPEQGVISVSMPKGSVLLFEMKLIR